MLRFRTAMLLPVLFLAAPQALAQALGQDAGILPHELSPVGMFLAADAVVKAVMIGLALASVATWTIWLVKTFELTSARRRARAAAERLDGVRTLGEAAKLVTSVEAGAPGLMVEAALTEIRLCQDMVKEGIKERIALRLERIEAAAGRAAAHGTGLLATIGSTGPFVGLFGTVWGIMNSFIGISKAHTTNLAVVAPGIAEALLATAIGLVAAIPAVVIYNAFSRSISGYRAVLGDSASAVLRLASRDLDRGRMAMSKAAE